MTAPSMPARQTFPATLARLFLALAWRAFAASQCQAMPSDIEEGLAAIFTGDMKENRA